MNDERSDQLLGEFAEVTAKAHLARPSLHGRRSAALGRALAAVLVVVVAGAAVVAVLGTRVGQGPAASAGVAVDRSGDYQLTLTTDGTEYTPTQAINAVAELTYLGNLDRVTKAATAGPIQFGIEQVGGSISLVPSSLLMCSEFDLVRDQPLSQQFTKSGGDLSGPNASFYRSFLEDPEFHLPLGQWEIYAAVDAGPDRNHCQGEIELKAAVTIKVVPGSPLPIPSLPTPFPPGVPRAPPVPAPTPTSLSPAWLACSAILDNIPMLGVRSGQPILVAARDVSRDQLANYIYVYNAEVYGPTAWRYPGTTTACWFDGDLQTDDPGPPHDTSAVRVLVVVDAGEAQLVAVARTDPSLLPLIDPATVPPQTGAPQSPTAPAASPSPTATPAIKVAADGTQWYELNQQALPFAQINTISVSGGRFVALGQGCGGTCLVTSEDGLAWSELGMIAAPPAEIIKVIHADGLWIAVGSVGGTGGGGLWTSSDGTSWQWRGDEAAFQHGGCPSDEPASAYIYEVYSAGNVIVAEGEDQCGTNRGDRATWQSADGLTWERAGAAQMFEIAKSKGAYAGQDENTAIHSSADGLNWSPSVGLKDFDIAAIATGFVGVTGSSPGMSPHRVITSADGANWTSHKNDLGTAWTDDLASDGSRAALLEAADTTLQPGFVWVSSTDGTDWTRLELPSGTESTYPQPMAILGNRIVVVGTAGDSNSPVVWATDLP